MRHRSQSARVFARAAALAGAVILLCTVDAPAGTSGPAVATTSRADHPASAVHRRAARHSCRAHPRKLICTKRHRRDSAALTIAPSEASAPATATEPVSEQVPIFSDEFDGPAGTPPDPTHWNAIDWCDNWGSLSCNTDRTRNVALDGNGHLRIVARPEAYIDAYGNRGQYTTARLETGRHFRFTGGTLAARIAVPAGRGLWPSFWTAGAGSWPATGEIDVMEILGRNTLKSYCSVHGADFAGNHFSRTQSYASTSSLAGDFHVYAVHWTANAISFTVDGVPCGSPVPTATLQPFTGQKVMVGMAVGGSWPGAPDSETRFPATMLVGWVRAYGA